MKGQQTSDELRLLRLLHNIELHVNTHTKKKKKKKKKKWRVARQRKTGAAAKHLRDKPLTAQRCTHGYVKQVLKQT